jgi:hypothetical protein
MRKLLIFLLSLLSCIQLIAQEIPSIYSNLNIDENGIYLTLDNEKIYAQPPKDQFKFKDFYGNPIGTNKGLLLDFKNPDLYGKLYIGFINYGDAKMPQPVYFKRTASILQGKAMLNIANNFSGRYDMVGWQKTGKGVIGYRIETPQGLIVYDGKIAFKYKNGKFEPQPTLIEGPFINMLTDKSVCISYKTTQPVKSLIKTNTMELKGKDKTMNHEVEISGLNPATKYKYTVVVGDFEFQYEFETAPKPGNRNKFTFAYASDSRAGQGGGERDIFGTNAYIMKKMAALAKYEGAKFVQFTGDMINGYETSKERMHLQYSNWKHAVEPFWHYIPFFVGVGNHEAYNLFFISTKGKTYEIDQFPFETNSTESIFQEHFSNFENGPESEDGSKYDPDLENSDFPSYKETVYWYSYDNVAIVVLNSNYLYTPNGAETVGGNPHAFIMDTQMEWLAKTISELERNQNIDHIFVTIHTPFFPNGGHVSDDMWYSGNNSTRAYIAGKPYEQGIIQRRDQLLDILVNKSEKTVALLTGDEHNYNLLTITDDMPRYTENYEFERLELKRKFYQINNGAAGAPYYAQEETPWMDHLRNFSTQNALVLIDIEGSKVYVRVKNPDTLEAIDEYWLRN